MPVDENNKLNISPAVGLVDMKKYGDWLTGQGTLIEFVAPSSSYVCY
jgi:hypothetical protein